MAGQYYGGGYATWTINRCPLTPDGPLRPQVHYDASTAIGGGPGAQVHHFPEPQTGVRFTMSPGTVRIDHYAPPSSLTLLLMAPVQTTPWTWLIGPVFLDPTNPWSDLGMAPGNGLLHRNFAIPPTIPLGSMVGVQGFAVSPTGSLLTSNVTVVGIW